MIRFIAPYALVPMIVALGWYYVQAQTLHNKVNSLEAALSLERLQVSACNAARINIKEDEESDATIENMPIDGLRDVPGRWIMPEAGTDSGGIP